MKQNWIANMKKKKSSHEKNKINPIHGELNRSGPIKWRGKAKIKSGHRTTEVVITIIIKSREKKSAETACYQRDMKEKKLDWNQFVDVLQSFWKWTNFIFIYIIYIYTNIVCLSINISFFFLHIERDRDRENERQRKNECR